MYVCLQACNKIDLADADKNIARLCRKYDEVRRNPAPSKHTHSSLSHTHTHTHMVRHMRTHDYANMLV
jgi:hypothetical protein